MSSHETYRYCDVVGCRRNSGLNPETTFFPAPTYESDPIRRQSWLQAIGRPEYFEDPRYRHVLVCSKHFSYTKKYIDPNSEAPQLMIDAIPTMYIPPSLSIDEMKKKQDEDMATETHEILEKIIKALPVTSQVPRTRDLLMKLITRLHKQVNSDRPYTEEFKNIIIRLYFENISTYHVLQGDLKLPPVSYLPKFISSKHEALNDTFMQSLKVQANLMSFDQLYCTLCVSMIKLKPEFSYDIETDRLEGYFEVGNEVIPENYALVGMVRGLFHEWQHIAGVTTIATLEKTADFHTWIDNVISKLFEIGLNLKLVISDTQDYLISALTQKNVCLEKPYFFTNENKKIYFMVDALHLFQLCSENDFHSSNDLILKLYENDQMRELKLAPRLTDKHFNPKPDQSLMDKLRDIGDILSLETSSGLEKSFELGLLEEQAMETAKFIRLLNRLIATYYNRPKNIFSISVFDEDFLMQMAHIFSGLEFIDADFDFYQRVSYICFIVTLNCLPLLRKELAAETDTILNTRYLNQDPLIDIIDEACLKTRNYKNPTKAQLFGTLKRSLVQNFKIIQSSKDMERFVNTAQEIISIDNICKDKIDFGTEIWRPVGLKSSEANSLVFITSFLLEHIYQDHKQCKSFSSLARSSRINIVCEGKKQSTLVPNNDLVRFVENMDELFIQNFSTAISKGPVVATLVDLAKQLNGTHIFCQCLPVSLMREIFMSLRVDFTVKYNNELLLKELTDVLVLSSLK